MVNVTRTELKMSTMAEVAKTFGVTVERVWKWTFDGLPSKNVNGSPMFWIADVIKWKRENNT